MRSLISTGSICPARPMKRTWFLYACFRYSSSWKHSRSTGYQVSSNFLRWLRDCAEAKKNILPFGSLFLVADKPAKHEHILVQINSEIRESEAIRCIDRQRRISDTDIYVNSYLTGLKLIPSFAQVVSVEQLYLEEPDAVMFPVPE